MRSITGVLIGTMLWGGEYKPFVQALLSCDEYAHTQITANFLRAEEVSKKLKTLYPNLPRKIQQQNPQYNLGKNNTKIIFEQTPLEYIQGKGQVRIVPNSTQIAPQKDDRFLSITNSSPNHRSLLCRGDDSNEASQNSPILSYWDARPQPSPVYYRGVAPLSSSISNPYNSMENTTHTFWLSPLGEVLTYVGCGLLVYGSAIILNKIQTGRFFQKPLSEIDILLAYKKGDLSLNQATVLLVQNKEMTKKLAVEFLTDTLPDTALFIPIPPAN